MNRAPSWLGSALVGASIVVAALILRGPLTAWFTGQPLGAPTRALASASAPSASARHGADGDVDHYTCSMHPSVNQPSPGKCPICGMDLVPVTKQQQAQGVVLIDEARRQLIGVRTEAVVEAPIEQQLRAVGRVTLDESALTDVSLKVSGWVSKLQVSKTGQRVAAGQTLFSLFSPELYNAQQDFLLGLRGSSEPLQRGARVRLHLLGMSDAQIASLEAKGAASESIAVPSPASGYVIEKDVVEGAAVTAGAKLFRIAALDKVWVEAELYEADLARVRVGDAARITLDYLPGRAFESKVAYVYPLVEGGARTGRVRLELGNRERELRPGMFASVELAGKSQARLLVPSSAVVYTGPRRLVFVDLGEGRFRPQEVQVGREANGKYEVLSGLAAGDVVASSGVFLIAAEARISTAAKYWDSVPSSASGASAAVTASSPPVHAAPPLGSEPGKRGPNTKAPAPAASYFCPMHPEVRGSAPGTCPKCGMKLEPVGAEGAR
jgi:membrane fusion protein, copper/silver efflux system